MTFTTKARKFAFIALEVGLLVLSFWCFVYSTQFLANWFRSNFADGLAFLYSAILLVPCFLLPIMNIEINKRLRISQNIEYPKTIGKEEYSELMPLAKAILSRRNDPSYGFLMAEPPIYSGMFFVFLSQTILGTLAQFHYLDFILPLPPSWQVFAVLVLFLIVASAIAYIPMILTLLTTLYLMRRYLQYPTDADAIFAACFAIGASLSVDNRLGAKRGVPRFLATLTQFSRNWFNNRRTVYSPEFTILRRSNMAISRMLMFSGKYAVDHIRDMFIGFGLALARGEDSIAFRSLHHLISSLQGFGEPSTRIQKILGRIERYPRSTTLLIYVLVLVVAIVSFILGYPNLASLIKG